MANATAAVAAPGINRREFLFYIWGASMALFTAELTGLIIWFLIPRFREGQFGGKFRVELDSLPAVNTEPVDNAEGRFWLVNVDGDQENKLMYNADDLDTNVTKGAIAIYKVCTHLGCIYAWVGANNRFECPCHGSKYRLDGRRIESPAPRTLDRFKLEVYDAAGAKLAESASADGHYLPLELPAGAAYLMVDTGASQKGPTQPLLCEFLGTC